MKNTRFEGSTPGKWYPSMVPGEAADVRVEIRSLAFPDYSSNSLVAAGVKQSDMDLIAAAPTLLERGQALAHAAEQMLKALHDSSGTTYREARGHLRDAAAAWRAETREEKP